MKAFLVGAFGAIVASVVILVGLHLYLDHQNLHTLVNMVTAWQQQQQKQISAPQK